MLIPGLPNKNETTAKTPKIIIGGIGILMATLVIDRCIISNRSKLNPMEAPKRIRFAALVTLVRAKNKIIPINIDPPAKILRKIVPTSIASTLAVGNMFCVIGIA